MIELVYVVFFWFLLFEVVLFLLLNMPTPHGIKGKVTRFLTTNQTVWFLMKIHLGACILAAFFFIDLNETQSMYTAEKNKLKYEGTGHIGSELRIGYLSYNILKVQRNKYITFMVIYTSLALNFYIRLMRFIYLKRDKKEQNFSFKNRQSLDERKETPVKEQSKKDK